MKIELYEEYIYYIHYFCIKYSEIVSNEHTQSEVKHLVILNQGIKLIDYLFDIFKKINLFNFNKYENQWQIQSNFILLINYKEQTFQNNNLSLNKIDPEQFNTLLTSKYNQLAFATNYSFFSLDISSISSSYHQLVGFLFNTTQHTLSFHFCSIEVLSTEPLSNWKKFYRISKKQLKTIHKEYTLTKEKTKQYDFSIYEIQKGFQFYFNCTYAQYDIKKRMLKALECIMFTDLTFKEIAYTTGFNNYNSLHRTFHQHNIHLADIPRFIT